MLFPSAFAHAIIKENTFCRSARKNGTASGIALRDFGRVTEGFMIDGKGERKGDCKMDGDITEKLYYEDAYRKIFRAKVLECTPEENGCLVVLDRTAFYPEGGGQPADIGVLNTADVLDVQEHGGKIFHRTSRPFAVGETVTGSVNWPHRFSLMQQHTGEHIVSGIAHRFFGVDNVGFHMGAQAVTVDFSGFIDENGLAMVERLANEAVYRDLPVDASFPSSDELKRIPYRSKKELTGAVRIVTVPGFDVCACCGTHVAHTGEIGAIRITDAVRYKGGTRIGLLCGARAMEDYREKERSVGEISSLLSAKPREVVLAVDRLLQENSALKRELDSARDRVFELEAAAVRETEGNLCRFEEELPPDGLRKFSLLLARRCSGAAAVFSGSDETGYRYALSSAHGDVRPLGKEMNQAFSGRGGGVPELVQGSVRGKREDLADFFASGRQRIQGT